MALFDPPDDESTPSPVRAYAVARRRWLELGQGCPETLSRFVQAQATFREALASRGGSWTVGALTYRDEGKCGIAIERTIETEPGCGGPE